MCSELSIYPIIRGGEARAEMKIKFLSHGSYSLGPVTFPSRVPYSFVFRTIDLSNNTRRRGKDRNGNQIFTVGGRLWVNLYLTIQVTSKKSHSTSFHSLSRRPSALRPSVKELRQYCRRNIKVKTLVQRLAIFPIKQINQELPAAVTAL